MRLDVLVPTYDRSELLRRTLESFLAARRPARMEFGVTVVDNNSSDGTRALVEEFAGKFGGRLGYLFEGRQGKSHALNSGIAATKGELVGIIDDDEEVDASWFLCVEEAFADTDVDFVGGPYVPRWGAEPPDWLPEDYPAVIGKVDGGASVAPYDENFPGMLMGGNCVIRRATLERVGPYATELGRIGKGLLCGEDEDMYRRLLASGARGFYRPDLVVYHHVPEERLTKSYFRRWCFWRGVSSGMIDRARPEQVAYLAGVPRYLYGRAARGLLASLKGRLGGGDSPARLFSQELPAWDLAGFFYGKHFYRPKAKAGPAPDGARGAAGAAV